MLDINIIRNIYSYDRIKIELYDKVLLELNNDFDKLKQKLKFVVHVIYFNFVKYPNYKNFVYNLISFIIPYPKIPPNPNSPF